MHPCVESAKVGDIIECRHGSRIIRYEVMSATAPVKVRRLEHYVGTAYLMLATLLGLGQCMPLRIIKVVL